jgi:Zn-dependent protease with chaperone function
VTAGRRGYLLLFGLGAIAFGNGFFLALTFYGLLVVVLHVFGARPPGFGFAVGAGVLAGGALLALAWSRERALRLDLAGDFSRIPSLTPEESPLVDWLAGLPGEEGPVPALKLIEGGANAFAVGRSREQSSIVITTGLLELDRPAQEAILAHELAHVRTQDLRATGLADALAGTVEDLAEAKGRIFWGPRRIFVEMLPFTIALVAGVLLMPLLPETKSNPGSLAIGFLFVVVLFGYLYALWRSTVASWRGLLQLFVYCTFLGPLTLLEVVLAPPTAVALSRLLSRGRVYEADETATELIGASQPLVEALQRLAYVEEAPSEEWFGGLRFSLFVTPRARSGWRGWLEYVFATHPSVGSRLQALAEAQERSREPRREEKATQRVEQFH